VGRAAELASEAARANARPTTDHDAWPGRRAAGQAVKHERARRVATANLKVTTAFPQVEAGIWQPNRLLLLQVVAELLAAGRVP